MFAALLSLVTVASAAGLTLPIPSSPPANGSQYLAGDLASFSIEFAFFPEFIGNTSNPNALTSALLSHITNRTGVPPSFRPGGITVDSSTYQSSAPALTNVESATGGIYETIYGPDYFQSLSILDTRTQFVFDLNFGNNSLDIALAESQEAFSKIPASQLYAFELGNEPDHYGESGERANSTWNALTYTQEWVNWTVSIQSSLGITEPRFVAVGVAENPPVALFNAVNCVQDGIANGGTVKAVSQHMYQYSTCDPTRNALATLPNLVNHANITSYVDLWIPQIAAAHSINASFITGEFNSVSCSGKANVTDTFGQALWIVDTMLYGASLNISKMFLHQGATLVFQSSVQANSPGFSHYNTWYPVDSVGSGPAHASPSFVAFLLIAEAVGSSGKSRIAPVTAPVNTSQLGAYAIWDDSLSSSQPSRLVLINTDIYNATDTTPRTSISIDVSSLVSNSSVMVKRMTAPGLDEQDSTLVTWAGQQYYNGTAVGDEVVEWVNATDVTVNASEGLLVFLSGAGAASSPSASGSGAGPSASAKSSAARGAEGWGRLCIGILAVITVVAGLMSASSLVS